MLTQSSLPEPIIDAEIIDETSLSGLAMVANRYHADVENATRSIVESAWYAGKALKAAKDKCGHGRFLPWLKENFVGSERHAQNYMQIAANTQRVADLEAGASLRDALKAISRGDDTGDSDNDSDSNGAHVGNNSGDNEWYTPTVYIDAAIQVMGGIDLDPATSRTANDNVGAATFYTVEDNGLEKPWQGRLWMNPPYAQPLIQQFCTRMAVQYEAGNVTAACVLVNNATETVWFQTVAAKCAGVCFPRGRIKFWHPDKEKESAPLQGQAVIYLGPNPDAFRAAFGGFGIVVTR